MKVTRKVEEWGTKSYIMVLRFFSQFVQQFKEQKSRFFRLTNVDMGAFCSRLAQLKLTSPALVFMFSNFPITAPLLSFRPFSVNHVLYLDTKLKHRPQKVITRVSTTAETIINWFTSHIFLHFTEHPLLSYISVVCETKCHSGLRPCIQLEHPLLSGTVR
jgi:hypothetical protein